MAETVCSWTGMGTFRIVDSALVKRAVQCLLNAFGATQPPEGSRVWPGQGATSHALLPSLKRSTAVAGGLRHHVWLEHAVAKAVAGSTGATGAKPTSTWSQSVSLARGKLRQGASSIARHRQPLHLHNDSCHGKPTTDRPSTSHPKNSPNLQKHRQTPSFLHTTQLSGSSLPRTNRILVPVPTSIHEIGPRATRLYDSLTTPIPTAKMSGGQAMSDAQVRRYPAANSGRTGYPLKPPFLMVAVNEPCSP